MENEAIISIRDVDKSFGTKKIYEALSLDVKRGETITIIGGSGTGKSVLLKLMIGLLSPDRGEILFEGADVTQLSERELMSVRKKVAMLFQGAALFDSLSVKENVAYALREHLNLEEAEIERRVNEKLKLVGLEGTGAMMPADLSGGMKKRVSLARAIAIEPSVILYDEPTTGLDPTNVRRINELIRLLKSRLSVTSIVVTHDMESAFYVSDRLALLFDRRIYACGSTEEIRNSKDEVVRNFIRGEIGE